MADFTISANYNINPPQKNFNPQPASISFNAAQPCVLNFTPATGNCFGVPSVSLAGGGNSVDLTVVNSTPTDGEVTPPPNPDAQQNPDTFEITFN